MLQLLAMQAGGDAMSRSPLVGAASTKKPGDYTSQRLQYWSMLGEMDGVAEVPPGRNAGSCGFSPRPGPFWGPGRICDKSSRHLGPSRLLSQADHRTCGAGNSSDLRRRDPRWLKWHDNKMNHKQIGPPQLLRLDFMCGICAVMQSRTGFRRALRGLLALAGSLGMRLV